MISAQEELKLRYSPHRLAGLLIFMVGIFWLAMLPSIAKMLSPGGAFSLQEMLAFTPFLGMALVFCYVGLAKSFNRTEILLTSTSIDIAHRPFPWPGNRHLSLSTISKYEIRRDQQPEDSRYRVTLGLVASLKDGKKTVLLNAIASSKVARALHKIATAQLDLLR